MSRRLIYVIGPSGAGKDSLLEWLRVRLPPDAPLHFARRTLTRVAQVSGERHESVDEVTFARLVAQRAFALAWQANGTRYGIRRSELDPLWRGQWVLVNGSRGYLSEALEHFPRLRVVHVTARVTILRQRLLARGREDDRQIGERIARASAFTLPAGTLEVRNDRDLEGAGQQLLSLLQGLDGWPNG